MMNKKSESLLDLAEADLSHARDNLRTHPRHAAFSIEQAAEKLIKAILTSQSIAFPSISHQLDALVQHIPASNPFKADLLDLTRLAPAATKYRYPTPRGDVPDDPPIDEMTADMEKVALLLPEVRAWLREED